MDEMGGEEDAGGADCEVKNGSLEVEHMELYFQATSSCGGGEAAIEDVVQETVKNLSTWEQTVLAAQQLGVC